MVILLGKPWQCGYQFQDWFENRCKKTMGKSMKSAININYIYIIYIALNCCFCRCNVDGTSPATHWKHHHVIVAVVQDEVLFREASKWDLSRTGRGAVSQLATFGVWQHFLWWAHDLHVWANKSLLHGFNSKFWTIYTTYHHHKWVWTQIYYCFHTWLHWTTAIHLVFPGDLRSPYKVGTIVISTSP